MIDCYNGRSPDRFVFSSVAARPAGPGGDRRKYEGES